MVGYGKDGDTDLRRFFDDCLCVRFGISPTRLPAKLGPVAKGVNLQCAAVECGAARQFERPSNGIICFGSRIVVVHVEKVPDMTRPRWDIPSGSRFSQRVAHVVGQNKIYGSPGRIRTADKVVNSHLLYQLSYGRS